MLDWSPFCSEPESSRLFRWERLLKEPTLDVPRSVAVCNEPECVGGKVIGRVTSGGCGFTVERPIAYAYSPPDGAAIGTRGEIDIFGEWIGFEVVREPVWDPEGSRIRS